MKTIIFDFDGTIGDSFELMLDIAEHIANVPRPSDEMIEHYKQMPLPKIVKELHIPLRRLPRIILQGRQKMHERMGEVKPFKGMPEVLKALHEHPDYQLLLMSTNSAENIKAFLRANNLEEYFDSIEGGVAVFNKASALKKTLRRHHIAAKDCYYVGDEVRDVVAASKVGIEPVSVSWGFQGRQALVDMHPYALVDKPAELLAVFTKATV